MENVGAVGANDRGDDQRDQDHGGQRCHRQNDFGELGSVTPQHETQDNRHDNDLNGVDEQSRRRHIDAAAGENVRQSMQVS